MPINTQFHVGLKALLRRGDEFLFLRVPGSNKWDLPGGRIEEDERGLPLEKILARELEEELGSEVSYQIGKIAFVFRRHFPEKNLNVLILVYEVEYRGGAIQLSGEHSGQEWINPKGKVWTAEEVCGEEERSAYESYFGQQSAPPLI